MPVPQRGSEAPILDSAHSAQVDAWLARAGRADEPERLLALLARGFDALWRRAYLTLGEVTLTAIADRVLHHAVERLPMLQGLTAGPAGLDYTELLPRLNGVDPDELRTGVRIVLIEFLTILSRLTAEVLTPALYSELARAGTEPPK